MAGNTKKQIKGETEPNTIHKLGSFLFPENKLLPKWGREVQITSGIATVIVLLVMTNLIPVLRANITIDTKIGFILSLAVFEFTLITVATSYPIRKKSSESHKFQIASIFLVKSSVYLLISLVLLGITSVLYSALSIFTGLFVYLFYVLPLFFAFILGVTTTQCFACLVFGIYKLTQGLHEEITILTLELTQTNN